MTLVVMVIFLLLGPPIGFITFSLPALGSLPKTTSLSELLLISYLGGIIPAFIAGIFNSAAIILIALIIKPKKVEGSTLAMCGGIAGLMVFFAISLGLNKLGGAWLAAVFAVPGIACGYLVNGWAYTYLYNSFHRN